MKKREIKFRVWDKLGMREALEFGNKKVVEGCIRSWEDIQHLAYAKTPAVAFRDILTQVDDNYILMQFTGLMDKSEKEIYEGDILRDKTGAIMEVAYRWCGFKAQIVSELERIIDYDTPDKIVAIEGFYRGYSKNFEVIGNIYENPELLEGKL